jgi:signal transduction histidine kinase
MSPSSRGPLLAGWLVFLVALAPLGWLFTRLRSDAASRDAERLAEFADASRKALWSASVKHQQMMQTWRNRIAASRLPLDRTAWEAVFEGPEKLSLGRFRMAGYARWEDGGRLVVLFTKSNQPGEKIAVGADLAAIPGVKAALEREKAGMRGMVCSTGPIELPGIGVRNLEFTSLPDGLGEPGVIFTSVVAADFLTPVITTWARVGTQGGGGNGFTQSDSLPGVSEDLVWIESLPPGGEAGMGNLPEIKWNSDIGGLHLVFHPGPKFARDSLAEEAWIVLGSGTFVALLLAALAWMQARQRGLLRSQVEKQTAELRELNLSLGHYKAIIDTTSDMVGLSRMDGTPIFMNRAGRTMLGIGLEESLEAFPIDRVHFPETLELFAREGIPHAMVHGSWSAEINMRHRDEHGIPVAFEGVVIRSADGAEINLGFIARDITASRLLDSQLRAALENERELVRMKSQFVHTVSHEFRTPLGVILSSADILSHYLDRLSPEVRREHLDDVSHSCRLMSRMLEQVLLLGSIEAGKASFGTRPLDLAALLSRLVDESSSASQGGPIHLDLAPGLDSATGDEALLRHIFLNLLSNGRKYSAADSPVEFVVKRDGCEAVFTIRDHGIGIPAEDMPHLFESFSRGSNVAGTPGTGLGLAIVQRCVSSHAGTLDIESGESQGTLVTVRLPLFPAAASIKADDAPRPHGP